MEIELLIQKNIEIYTSLMEFIDNDTENVDIENLIKNIEEKEILKDKKEISSTLQLLSKIADNHHRLPDFIDKLGKIINYIIQETRSEISDFEIYQIFKNNKRILLFLLEQRFIQPDEQIISDIKETEDKNYFPYSHYLYSGIKSFIDENEIKKIESEIKEKYDEEITKFEEKCRIGENDSYICSLIRQDSAEEFIPYVNRTNISLSSQIQPSIFETNSFLMQKTPTLIEYASFFGAIQIFGYLLTNEAKLTPSLWLYVIHSKNAEMILLLESNKVSPPRNYEQCFFESIKCHHNDFADYIKNNYIDQNKQDSEQEEEIISNCIKYHNYSHFKKDIIIDHYVNDSIINYGFFYLSFYHYDKLFELLLKEKEKSIEEKMIQYQDIQEAAENNEIEVIYHYLLKKQEISGGLFKDTKIKQIVIPSCIKSIGNNAFYDCSSLTQISIPSSVTSIGNDAFHECSSLTQITIPSSVTSIGKSVFIGCSSLTQITIPSSVTSIGESAFSGCSSLTQISIPSSITSIGFFFVCKCPKLDKITIIPCDEERITYYENKFLLFKSKPIIEKYDTLIWTKESKDIINIPNFIEIIGNGSFSGCSSLTQITIPSSVTLIGNFAFSGCSLLTQITIPSSVTSIGRSAFSECSSLTEITIPSSVSYIGHDAFKDCENLYSVKFDNNNPSIEIIPVNLFDGCSSLVYVELPDSITKIDSFAFNNCTSLLEITIPPSVEYLEPHIFDGCTELIKIIDKSKIELRSNYFPNGVYIEYQTY